MSVTAENPIASSVANGVTTSFPYSFTVYTADDLVVTGFAAGAEAAVVYEYEVDYTLTGLGTASGSVEFTDPPAANTTIRRYRSSSLTRSTQYQQNGDFLANVVNPDFDRIWHALQDIEAGTLEISSALRLQPGETTDALPPLAEIEGKLLSVQDGNIVGFDPSDVVTEVAYGHWRTDTFDGDGSTVQFTLTADPGSINNIDLRVDTVSLTPGIDFSLSGLVITLLTVIPEDDTDNVVARYGQAVPVGELSSSAATYLPPGATTARTVESKLREEVSLEDYWFLGADPTGVLDSSAAYAYAASQAKRVTTNKAATYRFSSPVTLPDYGSEFVNKAGVASVVIMADHVLGAGIQLTRQHQKVIGFYVKSSATRYAAAVSTFNPGIAVGGAAAGTNFLTHCMVWDNIVEEQPGIGIYLGGEGGGTQLHRNAVNYCKGHAIALDDGTIGARPSSSRCGMVTLSHNRSVQCGGNGVNISQGNSTCYRILIDNHESIDCAWNTDIVGLLAAQFVVRGQNIVLRQCGGDDSGFANTTMSNGKARYAKVAAGDNVDIRNGATNVRLEVNRSLSVARDAVIRAGVVGVTVADAYSNPGKSVGYRVEAGTSGIHIELSDASPYTTPVSASLDGVRGRIAGKPVTFANGSASYITHDTVVAATIAANSLNAAATTIMVAGQGGVADDLQALYLAGSGVPIPPGVTVQVINTNAYPITVKHGLTNIFTKSGADVALTTNKGISLCSFGGNLYEV